MAELFISHSSKDKELITQISVDLLFQGIPVWLDKWEIHFGDLITKKINAGIDASDYFLLLLSPASVESKWVKMELRRALRKERKHNRKFIIPVKLEECTIPKPIRDRLYADFSRGDPQELDRLIARFRSLGLKSHTEGSRPRMIPFRYLENMHPDEPPFEQWLKKLLPSLQANSQFSADELVVHFPKSYRDLRTFFLRELERQKRNPQAEREWINTAAENYEIVKRYEDLLEKGLIIILNSPRDITRFGSQHLSCAVTTFASLVASVLLEKMELTIAFAEQQVRDRCPPVPFFGKLGLDEEALGELYGTRKNPKQLARCDIWQEIDGHHFGVGVFLPSGIWNELHMPYKLVSYLGEWDIARYVVPQMVLDHLTGGTPLLIWDFYKCWIGRT